MKTNVLIAMAAGLAVLGIGLSGGPAIIEASASPGVVIGDDNGDGIVMEDESGWSCAGDGNRVCGPGNAQGLTPACYDDLGVIVAFWPCHVKANSDGSSDVYAD